MRKNSYAIEGGAFGDEGKGKIVDELASKLSEKNKEIIVYRWNGGANAGHTVIVDAQKIVLHHIPSGALTKGVTAILGKGMVLNPGDLMTELVEVSEKIGISANLVIDEMAVLSLDTHRVFEGALRDWEKGGQGSTGRGIAPAYADVLLRHPLRMRDLVKEDWEEKFTKHYQLYAALIQGLGKDLKLGNVSTLHGGLKTVGDLSKFLGRISFCRSLLLPYIKDVTQILQTYWASDVPFIFEGAQGVGLDPKWGVYPDVTASDVGFSGIFGSTQGIINPDDIEYKIAVYKATYMSSVGKRRLPSKMQTTLANKIRKDANEYGATTGRPRDIYNLDIPALKFFKKVTGTTHMVLTHLDVSYKNIPINVCVEYKNTKGDPKDYRPDQQFMDNVRPVYRKFKSWDGNKVKNVNSKNKLNAQAKNFIGKLSKLLNIKPFMVSTGPQRSAIIYW